jgi:hypothetical protein
MSIYKLEDVMLNFVSDRNDLNNAILVVWDQGGRDAPTTIDDTNAFYDVSGAVKAKVSHIKFTTPTKSRHILVRTDQVNGDWEGGNFNDDDRLLFTDNQSDKDGPITIEFVNADLVTPAPISAAIVQIQTFTDGNFTGVIRAVDTSGVIFERRRLGNSNANRDNSAICLGVKSDVADIVRIDILTTNIVSAGHARFDRRGFAINQLSVIV